MRKPLVSVLVLTYNHEKYIQKALDSILEQNVNFSYEILIGDDCSTDATKEIIEKYLRRYNNIRYFRNKTNLGATKNAANLLNNAQGIYLATCEGDDFWIDKNKLKIQVNFLEENLQFIGCTHDCIIVNENNKLQKEQDLFWVKKKKIFSLKDFKGIYLPGQISTIVRRNLFINKKIKVDEIVNVHPFVGDRTIILLYLLHGNFFYMDTKMSCYRRIENGDSITNKLYKDHYKALKQDYDITCKLEKLAFSLGKKVDFGEFKSQIFLKALIWGFFKYDKRFFYLIYTMKKDFHIKYLWYIFKYFIHWLNFYKKRYFK